MNENTWSGDQANNQDDFSREAQGRSYNNDYGRGTGYGARKPYRSRQSGENYSHYESRPAYGQRPRFNNDERRGDNHGYRDGYRSQDGFYGNRRPSRFSNDGGYSRYGGGNGHSRYGNNDYQERQGEGFRRERSYIRAGEGDGRQQGFKSRFGQKPRTPYNNGKRRVAFDEKLTDPNAPIRLNKFLANAGVCSRRDADKYIEAGVVKVNGEVVTELGVRVRRTDEILFHDQAIKIEKKLYVLLNKPKGYVTTSDDPQNRKTVMDLVKGVGPERIYPVGRLDRNTTGVLLLTNDGELASRLTHPKYMKKKIYHVFLDKSLNYADMQRISEGVELEDGMIKADDIQYTSATDKKQVGIEIHSGKNRIVRRIFESLGYHVTKLDRVFFAGLTKKNLRRGDWRYLTEAEVNFLRMGSFE